MTCVSLKYRTENFDGTIPLINRLIKIIDFGEAIFISLYASLKP